MYLTQQRCEECSRSSQAIDAQGIVRPVLIGPFTMVNQTGRKRLQCKVAHAVRPYHHRRLLFVELIHNTLQCVRRTVKVVTVQLNGKPSATVVINSHIPTAANTQIPSLGNEVNQPGIVTLPVQQFRRPVGGMVVHHNDVILKSRLLIEC